MLRLAANHSPVGSARLSPCRDQRSYNIVILVYFGGKAMKSKIVSITVLGLVIGAILGLVGVVPNTVGAVIIGGIVGFLVGWFWNSRSEAL